MNKSDYEKQIIKDRGEEYFKKNKSLLDAQYEYIESLGDPDDIVKKESDDLQISENNSKT